MAERWPQHRDLLRRWQWYQNDTELAAAVRAAVLEADTGRERIDAALVDLEHVRAGRATTHHDACWDEHVACLAARIRRTLTGEDTS